MFTGIIEEVGTITEIIANNTNLSFWVAANFIGDLKVDESIAHNGVCLTVEEIQETKYRVTAIEETFNKTNLNLLNPGAQINLERAIVFNGRIDGHLVQGHVDCIANCTAIENKNGSHLFTFSFPEIHATYIVEKGSICINGVSLTVFNCTKDSFQVAIIPYTFAHTTFSTLQLNDKVNLEFDVIGKYFNRWMEVRQGK
ncbi:MAG: riboflavin synthase [Bacteroidetes bacterium]|nr:riboflavin synthase [Bacteroidota bacterium]